MNPSYPKTPLPPDVRAWMEELPGSERAVLEEAWDAAEEARPPATPDPARKAAVWAVLEAAMDASAALPEPAPFTADATPAAPRRPQPAPSRAPHLRLVQTTTYRWLAAAAVVVLLFGVGIGYWLQPVTVAVPNGQTAVATLPDGSQVHLNSGSVLTHPRRFGGDERQVTLEGEAFFEVVRNPDQPFVVETFNARTTVLGTSFNVRARRSDLAAGTSVVVATGRVRLAPKAAPDAGVVLTPGLTTAVAAGDVVPALPDSVELSRTLAWRTGGFEFENQPLGLIFAEIGRRYDVSITARPDVQQRASTYYKHIPEGAEDLLKEITLATGLRYRKTANGYEVYAP